MHVNPRRHWSWVDVAWSFALEFKSIVNPAGSVRLECSPTHNVNAQAADRERVARIIFGGESDVGIDEDELVSGSRSSSSGDVSEDWTIGHGFTPTSHDRFDVQSL